jgi:radical SAM superfamily enzyme YgiQ (UPF0313 family)
MKHALLVNPAFPPSYWSYSYALEFVNKKANIPPLGLLTVAGLFPPDWELRLVDMNVQPLCEAHLAWADVVFTSSMIVQERSLLDVVARCNATRVPVVVGGPHPTSFHAEINARCADGGGVDHFVLGEAETIFAQVLQDLRSGTALSSYGPSPRPDVSLAPVPRFDLIDPQVYGSMALQFSRGCPFDCEFCDITALFGRQPRTKSNPQMLAELDALHASGWRGSVFLVDDNFIGNKRDALRLLEAVKIWQEQHGFPFSFMTEASVNLAELPKLLEAMRACAFNMVFLGIESPGKDALLRTSKGQNVGRRGDAADHLLRAVHTIQSYGMEVSGGFIIGLDGDVEFDGHLAFIRAAGIPMAMAGILTAFKGTRLHERLAREGRLLGESTGSNTDIALNFVPELPPDQVLAEYRRVISELYEPSLAGYFERCLTLFEHLAPRAHDGRRITWVDARAAWLSIWRQLLSRRQGATYARYLWRVATRYPKHFPEAVRLAVKGYHFERVTRQQLEIDAFQRMLHSEDSARRIGAASLGDGELLKRHRQVRARVDSSFAPVLDEAMWRFHGNEESVAPP